MLCVERRFKRRERFMEWPKAKQEPASFDGSPVSNFSSGLGLA